MGARFSSSRFPRFVFGFRSVVAADAAAPVFGAIAMPGPATEQAWSATQQEGDADTVTDYDGQDCREPGRQGLSGRSSPLTDAALRYLRWSAISRILLSNTSSLSSVI